MLTRVTRRAVLVGLAGAALAGCASVSKSRQARHGVALSALPNRLAALEAEAGGRLGVSLIGSDGQLLAGWRDTERFALLSVFKLFLAGMTLKAMVDGKVAADAVVTVQPSDLVVYAPVVEAALREAGGQSVPMALFDLARAAQVVSDNAAANLLLGALGGPTAFTAFMRTMGDTATRLDRIEPDLNSVLLPDARDTTTPAAIAQALFTLLGTQGLAPPEAATLTGWMQETRTGLRRLRAGLPAEWQSGDKTGTAAIPGQQTRHNDLAILTPTGRGRMMLAAFYEAPGSYQPPRAEDDAVLAETGRLVAMALEDDSA